MKIIRDEEFHGIMMIPLFVDWGIKRCNVKDCINEPSTIITSLTPGVPVCGLCETCYQGFKERGVLEGTLVFDRFDAFKMGRWNIKDVNESIAGKVMVADKGCGEEYFITHTPILGWSVFDAEGVSVGPYRAHPQKMLLWLNNNRAVTKKEK